METTASALGNGTGAVRGEAAATTHRGEPRAACMCADQPSPTDEDRIPAFGMWRNRAEVADVDAYVREARKGRRLAG